MAVTGPPEEVMSLAVPGGYPGIGHRQVGQGKESGTITNVPKTSV
jgi:hypothetical protein